MRICHASDWHGKFVRLPEADLYVFTGDMLPNFPVYHYEVDRWARDGMKLWGPNDHLVDEGSSTQPFGFMRKREIKPEREREFQEKWCLRQNFRSYLGKEDAPVLSIVGNHDFIDYGPHFYGETYEIKMDSSVTHKIGGFTFGGVIGVPPIDGRWAWETPEHELEMIVRNVPTDIDVFVTHAPPDNILDIEPELDNEHFGSKAFRNFCNRRDFSNRPLKAHLFGHVHLAQGVIRHGETIYSNAARTYHLLDI